MPGPGATGVQPRLVNCQLLPVFWFHIWKYQLCRPSHPILKWRDRRSTGLFAFLLGSLFYLLWSFELAVGK